MRKILRDDLEVPIDAVSDTTEDEGLFAEFVHEDILKSLKSIRRTETVLIRESVVLDQNLGRGHFCCSQIESASDEVDGRRLIKQGLQRMVDAVLSRIVCDFCGAEQTTGNKVINGPSTRICGACISLCRVVLDEQEGAEAEDETP